MDFNLWCNMNIEEFMKANPPKKGGSVLADFEDDIRKLRLEKFTFKKIKEYLELKGVITSVQNIRCYYLRNIKHEPKKEIIKNTELVEKKEAPNEIIKETNCREQNKSGWKPPSWGPKDLNLDDYI